MAITDLTGTTWLLNNDISDYQLGPYYINFTSNSETFSSIEGYLGEEGMGPVIYYGDTIVWAASWWDPLYRTISITGGTDRSNATLIQWLTDNATQQSVTPTAVFDLDTLGLSAGTYTITAKAEGSGFQDSVASNSVSYTVAPSGFAVHIKITYNNSATGWGKYSLDEGANYTSLSYNTEVLLSNVASLYVKCKSDDGPRVAIDTSSYKNYSNYNSANIDVLNAFNGDMQYDESDYSYYADITQYLQDGCYVSLILRG